MAKPVDQQFQIKAALTAVAIAYQNPDAVLIADDVLPRISAAGELFKWQAYDEMEDFTVPDTKVGRRSAPNRIEIEGVDRESSCEDYGIDIPLDNPTIAEARRNGWDPEMRATGRSMNIILLDREVRVARLIQDPANYHADDRAVLAGTDQFDHADSHPIDLILERLDECLMRPNQIVFGHKVWRKLRQHPRVVKAVQGNSGDSGVVSRQAMADLLEVQRVLVGAARQNIKKPGEAPQLVRCYGNTVVGQYIDRTADTTGGVTHGFTAVHGARVAGTIPVNMGIRGGVLVRAAETLKEVIVAKRAGFLLEDVLAA